MPRPVKDWRTRLARELRAARRLFVLGIGNPGRADDGAGSLCVRLLARDLMRSPLLTCQGERPSAAKPSAPVGGPEAGEEYHRTSQRWLGFAPSDSSSRKPALEEVQVLDGGEVPESATRLIREFRPTHVLIIDAASAGYEPGTIFFINKNTIRDDDLTTHRLPLSHLVLYLEESIGCRVILLGIEPVEMSEGRPMSPAVRRSAAILAEALLDALRGR